MTVYEYKILSDIHSWSFPATLPFRGKKPGWANLEKQLSDLTAQGWEIMSTHVTPAVNMMLGCTSPNLFITFVLRKPV